MGWTDKRHCLLTKQGRIWAVVQGGRVPAPEHIPPLWWAPVGFLGRLKRHLHVQDGAQVTCEVKVTHLLSVQHFSSVGLSTALLLPHIAAKSVQTHSRAAQAHLWQGWYVESSPAASGTLQGAEGEQTVVFHRPRGWKHNQLLHLTALREQPQRALLCSS